MNATTKATLNATNADQEQARLVDEHLSPTGTPVEPEVLAELARMIEAGELDETANDEEQQP